MCALPPAETPFLLRSVDLAMPVDPPGIAAGQPPLQKLLRQPVGAQYAAPEENVVRRPDEQGRLIRLLHVAPPALFKTAAASNMIKMGFPA